MTAENGLKLSRSARSYKRSRPSGVRTLSLHVAIECVANFTTHAILSALTKKKVFELLELKLRRGGTTYLRIKIAQCLFFHPVSRHLLRFNSEVCLLLYFKNADLCNGILGACAFIPGDKKEKMNDVAIRVTSLGSHTCPLRCPQMPVRSPIVPRLRHQFPGTAADGDLSRTPWTLMFFSSPLLLFLVDTSKQCPFSFQSD